MLPLILAAFGMKQALQQLIMQVICKTMDKRLLLIQGLTPFQAQTKQLVVQTLFQFQQQHLQVTIQIMHHY